jgi:hypothetical protein
MNMTRAQRITVLLALTIILLSALGESLSFYLDNNWPYIVTAVSSGAVSFFGLLVLTQNNEGNWELTEENMRTAIAGTIVLVYLVLVGTVAFFVVGPKEPPAITQTMMTSFTTIVGIVIAFYFGASAYIQVQREKSGNRKPKGSVKSETRSVESETKPRGAA